MARQSLGTPALDKAQTANLFTNLIHFFYDLYFVV